MTTVRQVARCTSIKRSLLLPFRLHGTRSLELDVCALRSASIRSGHTTTSGPTISCASRSLVPFRAPSLCCSASGSAALFVDDVDIAILATVFVSRHSQRPRGHRSPESQLASSSYAIFVRNQSVFDHNLQFIRSSRNCSAFAFSVYRSSSAAKSPLPRPLPVCCYCLSESMR
jgi:hypothetical protein